MKIQPQPGIEEPLKNLKKTLYKKIFIVKY